MYKESGIFLDIQSMFSNELDKPIALFNFPNLKTDFLKSFQNLDELIQNQNFDQAKELIKEIGEGLFKKSYALNFVDFRFISEKLLIFFNLETNTCILPNLLPLILIWTYTQSEGNLIFADKNLFDFFIYLISNRDDDPRFYELPNYRIFVMYIISNVIHDVFEDAIQIFLDLDGINKILDGIPSTENHTYISALNEIVGRIAEKMKGNTEVSERLFYYLRDNQPIKDKFYNYFFYTSLHDFYFLEKFICNCQENAEYVFKFIDFSELYRNLTSVNQNENGLEHLFKISRLLLKNAPKDVATYHFSRVDFAQITSFLREEKIKPQAEEELVKFLTIFFQEHHDSVLLAIQNDLIGLLKYYLRDGPVTVKVRVIQAFDNIYTIDSNTFPKDITDDNLIDMLLTLLDSDWSEIILNVVTILDKIVQKALNRKPGCGHFFEILERNDTFDSVKSLLESDDINIREAADNFLDKFDRLRNQEFELFGEDDEILYDISDNDQEYFK